MKGQLLVKQRQQAKLLTEKLTGTEINLEQTETETFDLLKTFFPEVLAILEKAGAYPYSVDWQTNFLNVLIVSKYTEEYAADLSYAEEGIAFAYVYNFRFPKYSEFGNIAVNTKLQRWA